MQLNDSIYNSPPRLSYKQIPSGYTSAEEELKLESGAHQFVSQVLMTDPNTCLWSSHKPSLMFDVVHRTQYRFTSIYLFNYINISISRNWVNNGGRCRNGKKSTDFLIITTAAAMANAFSTKHTEICWSGDVEFFWRWHVYSKAPNTQPEADCLSATSAHLRLHG